METSTNTNAENSDMLKLLKSISEHFDSLEKEVKLLKEQEARRSASEREEEPSNDKEEDGRSAAGSDSSDGEKDGWSAANNVSPALRKKPKLKRSRRTTRGSTHRDSSSSRFSSLSWSPSPRKRSRKGKSPVRTRSWADRMSDSEEE